MVLGAVVPSARCPGATIPRAVMRGAVVASLGRPGPTIPHARGAHWLPPCKAGGSPHILARTPGAGCLLRAGYLLFACVYVIGRSAGRVGTAAIPGSSQTLSAPDHVLPAAQTRPGDVIRKILAKRGLTKAVIDEAKQLLARAGRLESVAEVKPAAGDDEDFDKAEQALWSWYLEWITIVQTAIKDRRPLRELGFRRNSSSKAAAASEDADDDEEAEDDEADDEEAENDEAEPEPGAFLTGAAPPTAARKGR